MKKLSAYTVASNCTDLTDIRDGIAEIHEAMKTCVESGNISLHSMFPGWPNWKLKRRNWRNGRRYT